MSAAINGLASPTHHRLADQRMRPQLVLEDRGRDVLAAGGDDDLLLTADDRQEAVLVDGAEVASVEPSVDEGLFGLLLVVPVAGEHHAALDQQLFVVTRRACSLPGTNLPTDPTLIASSWLTVIAALVSVSP